MSVQNSPAELTAHDRCDRCQAQGYVLVSLNSLDLIFCSHHYNKHEIELMAEGFTVVLDERAKLGGKVAQDSQAVVV